MSLTVATSTVDTSWQELDVVEFTGGTISTIADMVTEVQDNLKRGTLSASTSPSTTQVQRWLIRGKEYFASLKNFQESTRYAYAESSSGTQLYSLPPDFRGGELTLRNVTDNYEQPITIIPATLFDSKYPDAVNASAGRPDVATIKGRKLYFRRPADGTYTLELQYARSGDDITSTDVSWLPEVYRFMICDYAIYRCFMSLHQWDAAQLYKAEWMDAIGLARRVDGKHKFGSQNINQAPLWFGGKR